MDDSQKQGSPETGKKYECPLVQEINAATTTINTLCGKSMALLSEPSTSNTIDAGITLEAVRDAAYQLRKFVGLPKLPIHKPA